MLNQTVNTLIIIIAYFTVNISQLSAKPLAFS